MAQFIGSLQGSGQRITRCGHRTRGLESSVKSYSTKITTRCVFEDGVNKFRIYINDKVRSSSGEGDLFKEIIEYD
jgi:hypothetical protein